MPLPQSDFPDGVVWDGTTPRARPSNDIYKAPDGEIGNRLTSEIVAIEDLIIRNLVISGTAGEDLGIGDVVYISASDKKAYKAKADNEATSKIAGCSDRVASENDFIYIVQNGVVSNSDWSLTAQNNYYLSPYFAGIITIIPPINVGHYLVSIGTAINDTQLAVNLQKRIRL